MEFYHAPRNSLGSIMRYLFDIPINSVVPSERYIEFTEFWYSLSVEERLEYRTMRLPR